MALKEMLPYRDEIIAMKEPPNVRTHDEVIAHLENSYNLKVSKPTVTRFLRAHAPHLVNSRSLTPEEEKAAIPFGAFLRIEHEIVAMREELGTQMDTLTERTGGKLAVLSADIAELEKAITHLPVGNATIQPISAQLLRRIWVRAFLVSMGICGGISAILWLILQP